MIDVTFTIGSTDYHALLSTYNVTHKVETRTLITTMDGTEHYALQRRPVIVFSFIPLTDAQSKSLYDLLSAGTVSVTYTDPNTYTSQTQTRTANFRVASDIESVFGVKSVDGNRYYKGSTITLQQKAVL